MLRLIRYVCMSSPLPRQVKGTNRSLLLPRRRPSPNFRLGRLLHYGFRGLLSVHSRYNLQTRQVAYATLYTGGFGGFVTSAAAPVATGWSDPVPGRVFTPAVDQRLFTAHRKIPITLKMPGNGERKAHTCDKRWFRQSPPTDATILCSPAHCMIATPPEPDDSDAPVAGVVPVCSMKGGDEEDTLLLQQMSRDAEAYLRSFPWCGGVQTSFFGGGVGGVFAVFLFNIRPTRPSVDPWIWIVVGDIPSAYLPTEDAKNPAEVFKTYLWGMSKWVEYARSEKREPPGDDVPPLNVPATPEWAEKLEHRLNSLRLIIEPFFGGEEESDVVH